MSPAERLVRVVPRVEDPLDLFLVDLAGAASLDQQLPVALELEHAEQERACFIDGIHDTGE